ncbi:DsbA family protein [Tepidicaulis sp. LMO-SS28]|uniref:DsbA family protein n=1 Tax=Tepidicaulis sp. LMO-SS28 TaxID=3447455 RepID=UPI003EE2F8AC
MARNKPLLIAAAIAILVIAAGIYYFTKAGNGSESAAANMPPELAQEGPLGDLALGAEDAPVTIIEYASLTCNHCAAFHNQVYPMLKEKYIDTGKVRFIARAFPLDPVATAGLMVARCAGDERYFGFLEVLFERQTQWAYSEEPIEKLKDIAKQGGFTDESFDACLKNEELLDHIRDVQKRAYEQLEVGSTPTFFINGEKLEGAVPFAELEKILAKHLPES